MNRERAAVPLVWKIAVAVACTLLAGRWPVPWGLCLVLVPAAVGSIGERSRYAPPAAWGAVAAAGVWAGGPWYAAGVAALAAGAGTASARRLQTTGEPGPSLLLSLASWAVGAVVAALGPVAVLGPSRALAAAARAWQEAQHAVAAASAAPPAYLRLALELVPTTALALVGVAGAVSWLALRWALAREGAAVTPLPSWLTWRVPPWGVVLYLAGLAVMLGGNLLSETLLTVAGMTVANLAGFALLVQGLAVVGVLVRRLGAPVALWVAVAAALLLVPSLAGALPWLGLADGVLDLRGLQSTGRL